MENSQIFQIWFDPDLSKTLKKEATYDDYKDNEFDKVESKHAVVKLIKSSNSNMEMDTEGVAIKEYFIKKEAKNFELDILNNKVHSFLILEGSIKVKNDEYSSGTFFKVSNTDKLEFDINSDVKIFEITTPQKTKYKTYASTMV